MGAWPRDAQTVATKSYVPLLSNRKILFDADIYPLAVEESAVVLMVK